jgi:hypothetical protein
MLIQYIGKKPIKYDTINDTGMAWIGNQVCDYPDEHAAALLKHTDIWIKANPENYGTIVIDSLLETEPVKVVFVEEAEQEAVKVKDLSQTPALSADLKPLTDTVPLPTLTELLASLSTKAELHAFCKENNVKYANSMNEHQLRAKLLKELNV